MWIVPGVVGAVLAGGGYPLSALLMLVALLLFWARYPVWVWARSRPRSLPVRAYAGNLVVGLVGIAMVAYLVLACERWALIGFGALAVAPMLLHLWLATSRRERSIAAEFLGISGLGLVGPATYYAASGNLDTWTALSWLLPALFFGTSVFSVKLRVEGFARVRTGAGTGGLLAALVAYQTMAVATLLLLVATGVVAIWVVGAYVPITLQAAWLAHDLRTPPRLKRLGLLWTAHSAIFALLLLTLM